MICVSVIITVYNAEKYIEECLESVCNQTLENIQIICIDDCSTDSSLRVIEQYKKKYPKIEIYRNEKNYGVAHTRNVGIKYASGEYIMFLDSDDYLDLDACRVLYEKAKTEELDVLHFSMKMFQDNTISVPVDWNVRIRRHEYHQMTGLELLGEMIQNMEYPGAMCEVIFRKEYLMLNNICFIEGILHEDSPFVFETMIYAQRASCINNVLYFYRQRAKSIMHTQNYEQRLVGLIMGYIRMLQVWFEVQKKYICNEKYNKGVEGYLQAHLRFIEELYVELVMSNEHVTDKMLIHFLKRFKILKKEDILSYFSKQDIDKIREEGTVAIYGAGKKARKTIFLLRENGIQVSKIYVTDIQKNPKKIFDIEVTAISGVEAIREKCIVIAVSASMQDEIVKELNKKKFENYIRLLESW